MAERRRAPWPPGRPLVLDGGLGTTLEAMGVGVHGPAWSAAALHDDPDAVRAAHLAFFEAGADVAVTASYQVSFDGPAAGGADRDAVVAAIRTATRLAREAAAIAEERDGRRRLVAASVGPYGASRADGSEYTGEHALDVAALRRWHRPRLQALAATEPDLLAVETIPTVAEVAAVVAELDDLGVPAWVSLTAVGDRTRRDEPVADAFAIAAESPTVVAVGVNCCDGHAVEQAIAAAMHTAPGLDIVAYPNGDGTWDPAAKSWRTAIAGDPLAAADAWVRAGATLVGGCCRVTPAHIRALRAGIDAAS